MTTVTSLTADRMLAIEAASVVDGDVVGDNLILTKHDGTQINAGSVRGPTGSPGPVGQDLPILTAAPILDVGQSGQIRAGRQLTAADFTNMGLSAPLGLWNLSDLTDVSGNGRNLLNKGAVPFDVGINGQANTAAKFNGLTTQAFYIPDTGVNDPFRIKTGSWGCWIKTAKRGTEAMFMGKWANAGNQKGWFLETSGANPIVTGAAISYDGSGAFTSAGISDICDDRWHQIIVTYDGIIMRIYVDSILETSAIAAGGPIFGSASAFNIGAVSADGSTAAAAPHTGRIDEAFVTADVLSEDQIRNLYCVKISHTLAAVPSRVSLNVHRRRKGATLAVADFPTQPLRLYNFSGGSLGDEGSNGVALGADPGFVTISGPDGSANNAYNFDHTKTLFASDAGLPSGLAVRSYGAWFKTTASGNIQSIMCFGTYSVNAEFMITMNSPSGVITSNSGNDQIVGPFVADGQWHFAVTVEDNNAADGIRRKLYVDGRLVGISASVASITLGGPYHIRIGSLTDASASWVFTGAIDGVFICDYALTAEQIWKMYAKSLMALASSPKNPGDHVEAMSSNSLLATFDTLEMQHTIDLMVAP